MTAHHSDEVSHQHQINISDQNQDEKGVDEMCKPIEERKFIRFVCISDTHSKHDYLKLPKGDVLIHAGK